MAPAVFWWPSFGGRPWVNEKTPGRRAFAGVLLRRSLRARDDLELSSWTLSSVAEAKCVGDRSLRRRNHPGRSIPPAMTTKLESKDQRFIGGVMFFHILPTSRRYKKSLAVSPRRQERSAITGRKSCPNPPRFLSQGWFCRPRPLSPQPSAMTAKDGNRSVGSRDRRLNTGHSVWNEI